jgi:hypothetical protein
MKITISGATVVLSRLLSSAGHTLLIAVSRIGVLALGIGISWRFKRELQHGITRPRRPCWTRKPAVYGHLFRNCLA